MHDTDQQEAVTANPPFWRNWLIRRLNGAISRLDNKRSIPQKPVELDEFDRIEYLLDTRQTIPAERGWNAVFVGVCGCGEISLKYEPVIGWVIDVFGPVPVVHGGVLIDCAFIRRPDGTFTSNEGRMWMTEEELRSFLSDDDDEAHEKA